MANLIRKILYRLQLHAPPRRPPKTDIDGQRPTRHFLISSPSTSLPDTLKSLVDELVSQGNFGTSSEYVRELLRKDRDRLHLRGLLLAGATSSPAATTDPAYFEGLRDRVRKAKKVGDRG